MQDPALALAIQPQPQMRRAVAGDRVMPEGRNVDERSHDKGAQVQPRMWNNEPPRLRHGAADPAWIAVAAPTDYETVIGNEVEIQAPRAPAAPAPASCLSLDAMKNHE
jgi:hypothetical protein